MSNATSSSRPPPNLLADDLADFRRWPLWSPWLLLEPEARLDYHGTSGEPGSGYAWEGKQTGSGRMALVSRTPSRLSMSLDFLKPWKSHADVHFDLLPVDAGATRVTWGMHSSLPFFMYFLSKRFESMIGADYRRGLVMLKELHETGFVNSATEVVGVEPLAACAFIGRDGEGTLASLGTSMQDGFDELHRTLRDAGIDAAGPRFCHYRHMDPVRDHWRYTMAVPIPTGASIADYETRQRPSLPRCARVSHTGAYQHLGNAWSAAFLLIRADKLRHDKRAGGYEIYPDGPGPLSDVFVPLK